MPCSANYEYRYEPELLPSAAERAYLRQEQLKNQALAKLTAEEKSALLDPYAQMLCWACGTMLKCNVDFRDNAEVYCWWNDHNKHDEERVLSEMHTYLNNIGSAASMISATELSRHFINRARKVHAVSAWHINWFLDLAGKVIINWNNVHGNI